MRYQCNNCKKYVKDKFIFGLLHICNDVELSELELYEIHKKLESTLLPILENPTNSPQIDEYNRMILTFRTYK